MEPHRQGGRGTNRNSMACEREEGGLEGVLRVRRGAKHAAAGSQDDSVRGDGPVGRRHPDRRGVCIGREVLNQDA